MAIFRWPPGEQRTGWSKRGLFFLFGLCLLTFVGVRMLPLLPGLALALLLLLVGLTCLNKFPTLARHR